MEIMVILSIFLRIILSIIRLFIKTSLIYPVILLFSMSYLLKYGYFVEYWDAGNLFYWGFYVLLFLTFIPMFKKILNFIKKVRKNKF